MLTIAGPIPEAKFERAVHTPPPKADVLFLKSNRIDISKLCFPVSIFHTPLASTPLPRLVNHRVTETTKPAKPLA